MSTIETVRTIAALRGLVQVWRGAGESVGMVPTMGALHEGHLALARAAKAANHHVVATLFVNPTQFAPTEDLATYPRSEDGDRQMLGALGVDLLFAPDVGEMYPAGFDTKVIVGGPSAGLETNFRPHFFAGVATIVAKLLLAGLPDRAYFGEKDFQQLLVVRKMARDLGVPVEIVGCPTVREPDGLAMSSRNAYLSADERARAPRLHAALKEVAAQIRAGEPPATVLTSARAALDAGGFAVDYLEARNSETLAEVADFAAEPVRLLVAARLGRTRLIDNIAM